MTTTHYIIKSGPCMSDLLDSLLHGKHVWFKGFADDATHRPNLFVVRVTNLGIPRKIKGSWVIKGLIIKKNGQKPSKYEKCKAHFDEHERDGGFYEEEFYERNSYEYFRNLDNGTIMTIIQECKACMPEELKSLEAYSETLDARERLILEAMHVTALSDACMRVEVNHQLNSMMMSR